MELLPTVEYVAPLGGVKGLGMRRRTAGCPAKGRPTTSQRKTRGNERVRGGSGRVGGGEATDGATPTIKVALLGGEGEGSGGEERITPVKSRLTTSKVNTRGDGRARREVGE